ncbi:hypothetical protein G6F66_014151 [Rhizopus arrhizus]|nr:hypothetical protein G6F66_014151 [Rhizopus arrhizus]
MVGAEVARCLVLGILDRAGVVEQRTQLRHRDRQLAAQGVLTVELVEGAADRRLGERHAAGMARRMPGVVRLGRMSSAARITCREMKLLVSSNRKMKPWMYLSSLLGTFSMVRRSPYRNTGRLARRALCSRRNAVRRWNSPSTSSLPSIEISTAEAAT